MSKLEIGSGRRPTPGYRSNDVNAFPGIDIVANAWDIDLPDRSLDEVIALGSIEHLTYQQAQDTFCNVRRMLKPGGSFLFDVPDLDVWCSYLANPDSSPFNRDHVLATLYGWQRWPGDEHKSGWSADLLLDRLNDAGFSDIIVCSAPGQFTSRGIHRNRFDRPQDAHLYVEAAA